HYFSALRGECLIQAKIAHHSGNDRVLLQPSNIQEIQGGNGQDLVAVNNIAIFVTQQDTIGIAVVRNANVRAAHLHDALDFVRLNTTAAVVDVNTVWFVVYHHNVRA